MISEMLSSNVIAAKALRTLAGKATNIFTLLYVEAFPQPGVGCPVVTRLAHHARSKAVRMDSSGRDFAHLASLVHP